MSGGASAEVWESYFYPDTYDPATQGALRNLFAERDANTHTRGHPRPTDGQSWCRRELCRLSPGARRPDGFSANGILGTVL